MKKLTRSINKFNAKVAVWLTNVVGTMWCAYAFAALAFVSFPAALDGGTATLISWIAQTFLQLVLLSVIMVGQAVLNAKSEKRAREDHLMIKTQLDDIQQLTELSSIFKEDHVLIKQELSEIKELNKLIKTALSH
jgi:hypothetical protein